MTKEEKKAIKEEKKLIKRYTLCRFGKITTIILIVIFIVCSCFFGMGISGLNAELEPIDPDQYRQEIIDKQTADPNYQLTPEEYEFMVYGIVPYNDPLNGPTTVLLIIGAVGFLLLPLFIFRRFSLSVILMGVAFWDVGIFFPGMTVDGEQVVGIALVAYGLIAVLLGEWFRNKQKGTRNLTLDYDLFEGIYTSSDNGAGMFEALLNSSIYETRYKGSLYFLLSCMLVSMCGIGLLLPFGKWAYKYNKNLYFQTSDWDFLPENDAELNKKYGKKKYKANKPFCYLLDGLIYINEKPMYAKESLKNELYAIKALAGQTFSFGYVMITSLAYEIRIKASKSFIYKDDATLGVLAFSSKDLAKIDEDTATAFVNYSKKQSADSRAEFMNGLQEWYEESMEANRADLERIERYEQERDRVNTKYAKDAKVYVDDKGLYAEGYDVAGNKKQYKLEEYDERTGVGTYTDESGKKVQIKNNN